jgi:hypothetical protein
MAEFDDLIPQNEFADLIPNKPTAAPEALSVGPMGMRVGPGVLADIGRFLHQQMRSAADIGEGALSVLNMPVDFGVNAYNAISGGSASTPSQTIRQAVAEYVPPDEFDVSPTGQVVTAARRGIGGALPTLGAGGLMAGAGGVTGAVGANLAAQPVTQLASAASGAASGDVARQMGAPWWGQWLASAAGGAVPVLASAAHQAMAPNPNVPSKDFLRSVAQDKYNKLEQSGLAISPEDMQGMVGSMGPVVKGFGITNSRLLGKMFPKVASAIDEIGNAVDSQQPIPMEDVLNFRKLMKTAAGSIDPQERALAMGLSEKIDDMVSNSSSLPSEARDLWRRASNAEMVDKLAQRSADSASQFTGSGLENAIRTQFRQFIKNDKKMRMLRPEEQDAMRRVAEGTGMGNIMRALGRFAPRGPVSTGVDAMIGGGPVGAFGIAAGGEAARDLATRSTLRNIDLAREAMLSSGQNYPRPPIQWPIYGPLAGTEANQ